MTCCGQEVTTPFCPLCGERKRGDPLLSLLMHLRASHKSLAGRLREIEGNPRYQDGLGDMHPRLLSMAKNLRRSVSKWKSWIEAVERALAEKTSG